MLFTLPGVDPIDNEHIIMHALFECLVWATINKLCFKNMPPFHSNRPIPNSLHIKSLVKLIQACIIILELIVIDWVYCNLFTVIDTVQELLKGVNPAPFGTSFCQVKKMICNILGMANNQENKLHFFEVHKVSHHLCDSFSGHSYCPLLLITHHLFDCNFHLQILAQASVHEEQKESMKLHCCHPFHLSLLHMHM